MARLWIVHREGLKLVGHVAAEVSLETSVGKLDIAPWRIFSKTAPEEENDSQLPAHCQRQRTLLEVREEDRHELCGLAPGFFESPYSPQECLRRLNLAGC